MTARGRSLQSWRFYLSVYPLLSAASPSRKAAAPRPSQAGDATLVAPNERLPRDFYEPQPARPSLRRYSSRSLIGRIGASSSPPVTSLRSRAMNGTALLSSRRPIVAVTWARRELELFGDQFRDSQGFLVGLDIGVDVASCYATGFARSWLRASSRSRTFSSLTSCGQP